MNVDGVGGTGYSGENNTGDPKVPDRSMDLGADTFLKLLVTQMRYQDPFSGGEDMGDFMGQVAQFTMLERLIKLQQTLEDFTAQQAPNQALNLLNQTVEVKKDSGEIVQGEVTGVLFRNGMPVLKVNGEEYGMDRLVSVGEASYEPAPEEEVPGEEEEAPFPGAESEPVSPDEEGIFPQPEPEPAPPEGSEEESF